MHPRLPQKIIRTILRALRSAVLFLTIILSFERSQAAEGAGFPVVIEHALGVTTIPTQPQRIVTLGWSGEDAVLAFGIVPVAMTKYGSFPSGIFPWNEARLGGMKPTLLSGELDYERIAGLKPDLILGVYSGIDDVSWKRLSTIAPTVVYRSGPWLSDWREQMEMTGAALGRTDEARRQIDDTNAFLRDLGAKYPTLKGRTFAFGTYFAGSSGIVVYLPDDPRVEALAELGLKVPPGVEALGKASPGDFSVSVSLEEISAIDADILIMWYGPGARAAAEAQPLFSTLGAVKRGAYVALEDPVDVWSTSALSVLSVPYGFPKFVPRLAEAVEQTGE